MNRILCLLILLVATLPVAGCADATEDNLTTTVAPLTEAEAAALDACLKEVEDCRLEAADSGELSVECRAIMECLPDRPDDERLSGRNWRTFCAGLEERCMGDDVDETLCAELAERCEDAALVKGSLEDGEPVTHAECMEDCLSADIGDELCSERCADLAEPL